MIKDIVEILRNITLRHKGVKTFKYQGKAYNNAQNNYKTYQVYLDTVSLHSYLITKDIFTSEFEMYILSQPNGESGNTVEDVQTYALTIGADIIAYIDNDPTLRNVLSVYDYSMLTLANYSDDNSAGIKLSLVLQVPSPVNMCTLEDNFNDEPYEEEEDHNITGVTPSEITEELSINPIRLPRTNNC